MILTLLRPLCRRRWRRRRFELAHISTRSDSTIEIIDEAQVPATSNECHSQPVNNLALMQLNDCDEENAYDHRPLTYIRQAIEGIILMARSRTYRRSLSSSSTLAVTSYTTPTCRNSCLSSTARPQIHKPINEGRLDGRNDRSTSGN